MRALIAAAVMGGVGCGDAMAPPIGADASVRDASGDAAAAGAAITVDVRTVFGPAGVPVPDVLVAFIPPSGAPEVVATDAVGRARAVMPAGATVAIARLDFGQRELTVFVDVPAGAALIDGPPLPMVPGGADLGARQATVAPYVGVAQLAASCGGVGGGFGGQPLTWRQAACAQSGDATVVATSADDLGQRQYAARRHVDLARDAEVALPPWRPLATSAVVLTSVPEAVLSASVVVIQDDGDVEWNRDFVAAPVEGASLVLPVPVVPEPLPAQLEVTVAGLGAEARLISRRASLGPRVAIDIGSQAPPWLAPATLDVDARVVAWRYQGGGGRRPDAVFAAFTLTNFAAPTLRVVAPGTATAVTLPPLPPALAAWDVLGGMGAIERATLGVDLVGVTDYGVAAAAVAQGTRVGEAMGRALVPVERGHDWWISGR